MSVLKRLDGSRSVDPAPATPEAPSVLEAALALAQVGLRVFPVHGMSEGVCRCGKPCTSPGKHPIPRGWQEVATTDPEKVRQLFHEGDNIGVATGQGLLVLDVDPKNGGTPALYDLEKQRGGLPDTLEVFTGSGGRHYYFHLPEGVRVGNTAGKLGSGIDTRGDGGYVVAPPSLHASGERYAWVNWGAEIALAPEWMYQARERTEAVQPAQGGELPPASLGLLQDAAAALDKHGPAIEGEGGDAHTFRAGAIVRWDYGLNESEAWPLLCAWNRSCRPPWSEDDDSGPNSLRAKVFGDKNYQGEFGGRRLEYMVRQYVARLKERAPTVQPEPEPEPDDEFGQALAHAREEIAKRSGDTTKKIGDRLGAFVPLADLNDLPEVEKEYLVRHAIGRGEFGMLAGEAKATKTWFAMELACAIASGTRAFGEFETTQGRVAMLLTEDTQASALRRIRALLLHRGLSEAKVREAMGNIYILCRKRARVTDNEDLAVFVARCLMIEPALVVTDPLANLHQEEENDAVAMSAVAERFMWIRDIVSCSVLLIHHSGKRNEMTGKLRGGQRMRGSSAMHGHVEFGFYFLDTDTKEAPHSWVNVIETETKDGPSLGTFTVKLDVEDGPTGGAVKAVFGYSREVADVQEGDDRRLLNILDGYWRRARDAGASPEPLAYKRLATEAGMSHRNAKKLLEERLVPAGLVTKVLDKRGQPKGFVIVPRETVGAGVVKQ